MSRFIQLHVLTAYPPANLNRDDLGRPKTALMGGVLRLRVSSQSLKRAWRTSELFQQALSGHMGQRTRRLGRDVYQRLSDAGVKEKEALKWTKDIIEVFAKADKKFDDKDNAHYLLTGQLVHIAPEERQAVERLCGDIIARGKGPEKDELKTLRQKNQAVDIALFGRMLADNPGSNVEAAAQVAHALTVHPVAVEEDYFTAVDDISAPEGEDDSGAAHLGIREYGAGVFYLYLCIDRESLVNNLQGDNALAAKAIAALIECVATVAPGGMQASYGSRARASYLSCEVGDAQPRSLAAAFLKPVGGRSGQRSDDYLSDAINALEGLRENFANAYGDAVDAVAMNLTSGEGNLQQVIAHANQAAARG